MNLRGTLTNKKLPGISELNFTKTIALSIVYYCFGKCIYSFDIFTVSSKLLPCQSYRMVVLLGR